MQKIKCSATLQGLAPLQFSGPITSIKESGEKHDKFEERTWMERLHSNSDGNIFIPPGALKNCMSEAAQFMGEKIPGRGNATYTKRFVTGLMVIEPLMLFKPGTKCQEHLTRDDVEKLRLFVPSDGKRGGGKRVWKNFPCVREWEAAAEIIVMDTYLIDEIEKVQEYLVQAGIVIGMLAFRPINNGYFGRWQVTEFDSKEM